MHSFLPVNSEWLYTYDNVHFYALKSVVSRYEKKYPDDPANEIYSVEYEAIHPITKKQTTFYFKVLFDKKLYLKTDNECEYVLNNDPTAFIV